MKVTLKQRRNQINMKGAVWDRTGSQRSCEIISGRQKIPSESVIEKIQNKGIKQIHIIFGVPKEENIITLKI